MHDVFWCVLCVWAKLPEIKLDDDDDDDCKQSRNFVLLRNFRARDHPCVQ